MNHPECIKINKAKSSKDIAHRYPICVFARDLELLIGMASLPMTRHGTASIVCDLHMRHAASSFSKSPHVSPDEAERDAEVSRRTVCLLTLQRNYNPP